MASSVNPYTSGRIELVEGASVAAEYNRVQDALIVNIDVAVGARIAVNVNGRIVAEWKVQEHSDDDDEPVIVI